MSSASSRTARRELSVTTLAPISRALVDPRFGAREALDRGSSKGAYRQALRGLAARTPREAQAAQSAHGSAPAQGFAPRLRVGGRGRFDRRQHLPSRKSAEGEGCRHARALSLQEAGKFFNAARGSGFAAFFHVAASTGARRGERAGLKWDAVDLDAGALTVRTSLASTRAKKAERAAGAAAVVLKGTKSGKSRQVPLDGRDAVAVLRRVKAAQASKSLPPSLGNTSTKASFFRISTGVRSSSTRPLKPFERSPTQQSCLPRYRCTRCVIRSHHGRRPNRRRYCRGATLPRALRAEHDTEPIFARRSRRPGEGRRRRQRHPSGGPRPATVAGRLEMTPRRPTFFSGTDCTEIAGPLRQYSRKVYERKPA